MNILLLSQWYAPEPEPRAHLLAETLVQRGHKVTVLTGFPNYPEGRVYPGYRVRWRQWEEREGVRVLRVPLFADHSRSGLKRIANYASFALSALLLGTALCGPADVMWVYHPPLTTAIPALALHLARRLPFVYEIQDLWPETLQSTGMVTSPRALALVDRAARAVYARAAALTVISPGFKRNLVGKGVPEAKVHFIPNWADETLYQPQPRNEALGREFGLAGYFTIIYGGNLGAAQRLGNVLDAAERLRDLPDLRIILIGTGVEEDLLRAEAERRGLTNVRFIAQQPPERMPQFYAWADALLVHLRRDPLFAMTIPGKTTAYLASGRPILCAVEGAAAQIVREAGAGLGVPPDDPAALAEAMRTLHDMPREAREALGAAGRRAFLAHYTRDVLVGQYEALFQSILERRAYPVPTAAQARPGQPGTRGPTL